MNYTHTLVFIRYQDEFLLINREKGSWFGCWNGLGGKVKKNESSLDCALRETKEETGLELETLSFCGSFSWSNEDDPNDRGLIACYHGFSKEYLKTPLKYREGILDWKKTSWILNPNNQGIAKNIPLFINRILEGKVFKYHCSYRGLKLLDIKDATQQMKGQKSDG